MLLWVVLGRAVLKDDLQNSSLLWSLHSLPSDNMDRNTWRRQHQPPHHRWNSTGCRVLLQVGAFCFLILPHPTSMLACTQNLNHASKWRYSDMTELHCTRWCFVLDLQVCTPNLTNLCCNIELQVKFAGWCVTCDNLTQLSDMEHTAGKQDSKVFRPIIYSLSICEVCPSLAMEHKEYLQWSIAMYRGTTTWAQKVWM